jgi:DNA primase
MKLEAIKAHYLKNQKLALAYLQSRGINSQTALIYQIGYANNDHLEFFKLAQDEKIQSAELLEWRLINENQNPVFFHRIIFPLIDFHGKTQGFVARAINKNPLRYLNSKTDLHFFGLRQAKGYIEQQKTVILVEGCIDAMCLYQRGFKNVLASNGLPNTTHIKELIRLGVQKVCLMLDNEQEGYKAIIRLLEEQMPIEIDVIQYVGDDPATSHGELNFVPGKRFLMGDLQNETDAQKLLARLLKNDLNKMSHLTIKKGTSPFLREER